MLGLTRILGWGCGRKKQVTEGKLAIPTTEPCLRLCPISPALGAVLLHIPLPGVRNLIAFSSVWINRIEMSWILLLLPPGPMLSTSLLGPGSQTHPWTWCSPRLDPKDVPSTHLPTGEHEHQRGPGCRQPPREERAQHRLQHRPVPGDHADLGGPHGQEKHLVCKERITPISIPG